MQEDFAELNRRQLGAAALNNAEVISNDGRLKDERHYFRWEDEL